jgi:hypothetical protein
VVKAGYKGDREKCSKRLTIGAKALSPSALSCVVNLEECGDCGGARGLEELERLIHTT